MSWLRLRSMGLCLLGASASCHLVAGYDDYGFGEEVGVGPSAGGGTASGGSGGSGAATGGAGGDGGAPLQPLPFGEVGELVVLGGPTSERVEDLAIGADGSVYVVGRFNGPLDLAGTSLTTVGQSDALVVKLDATLTPVWARGFGSTESDNALAVALGTGGEVFVVGLHRGPMDLGDGVTLPHSDSHDCFVAALSQDDGSAIWAQSWGGDGVQLGLDVVVDESTGHLIVAGGNDGTVTIGPFSTTKENLDFGHFVAEVDPQGGIVLADSYDDVVGRQVIARVDIAQASGTLHVAGTFEATMDFYKGVTITQAPGEFGSFWARLDDDLIGVSAEAVAIRGDGSALDVAPTGEFVLGGSFSIGTTIHGVIYPAAGDFDGYLTYFDAPANPVFTLRLGDEESQRVTEALVSDDLDAIFFGGAFTGTIAELGDELFAGPSGDERAFIAAVGTDGTPLFALGSEGTSAEHSLDGMTRRPGGDLVVALTVSGDGGETFVLGDQTVMLDSRDIVLARIGGDANR